MATSTKIPMVYTGGNLSVILEGKCYNIPKETLGFEQVFTMIRDGQNEAAVKDYLDYVKQVQNAIKAMEGDKAIALGGDVALNASEGTMTYKGEEVHNSLTIRIVEMLEQGHDVSDVAPMAHFLNNVMQNPSMPVEDILGIQEKSNLPITPDGCFLAYKTDPHSWNKDGSVEYLQHPPTGGSNVVVVKINPQDVVSISVDGQKNTSHASKYEIVDIIKDFNINNPKHQLSELPISRYGEAGNKLPAYPTTPQGM